MSVRVRVELGKPGPDWGYASLEDPLALLAADIREPARGRQHVLEGMFDLVVYQDRDHKLVSIEAIRGPLGWRVSAGLEAPTAVPGQVYVVDDILDRQPQAYFTDADYTIFYARLGPALDSQNVQHVAIADRVVLDVDREGLLAGVWLLGLPPEIAVARRSYRESGNYRLVVENRRDELTTVRLIPSEAHRPPYTVEACSVENLGGWVGPPHGEAIPVEARGAAGNVVYSGTLTSQDRWLRVVIPAAGPDLCPPDQRQAYTVTVFNEAGPAVDAWLDGQRLGWVEDGETFGPLAGDWQQVKGFITLRNASGKELDLPDYEVRMHTLKYRLGEVPNLRFRVFSVPVPDRFAVSVDRSAREAAAAECGRGTAGRPVDVDEQAVVEHAEFLLEWSRLYAPIREPFAHNLAMLVINRRELARVLEVAEGLGIVSSRLEAVRRALPELDRERAAALEALGRARVRQALLDELEFKVADYQQRLDVMVANLASLSPQDYEEFLLDGPDEGEDNQVTLFRRTDIENLLAELGDSAETRAARARLAPADALLRSRGGELYGPFVRSGLMESMRSAVPEPPERWWYYLDQLCP